MERPDLDAQIDALYGLSLGEFTAERDALARRLRKEGDREGADAVKRLAKPSAAAWLVNQLARRHGGEMGELLDAAAERMHPGGVEGGRRAGEAARRDAEAAQAVHEEREDEHRRAREEREAAEQERERARQAVRRAEEAVDAARAAEAEARVLA